MLMQFERFIQLPWCLGENIRMFDYQRHLPSLDKESQQGRGY